MDISFLVTSHNEGDELKNVLDQLSSFIVKNGTNDEIVVLDDYSDNPKTIAILDEAVKQPFVTIFHHRLNKDFGTHKTDGSRACKKPWICQLDADEHLTPDLLENLREIITMNPTVEMYRVPRVNIVMGLTSEDVARWGWRVADWSTDPVINWPDYQARVYKNDPKISWKKKLHETIAGAEYVADLPADPHMAIVHFKTIERQRRQNEFYNQNWSPEANMGRG